MTTARILSVLLEADGPLVVLLRDAVDCAWLGTAVERTADGDEYLCIPVSASRLSQFRHGQVDLRSLFTAPEVATPAVVFVPAHDGQGPLELVPAKIRDGWLPDEGFLLTTFIEPVASEFRVMASEATEANRAVVYLNLNPPEAREAHVIDTDRLGRALQLFQTGIRHASTLANKSLSVPERRLLAGPENYLFEVFGFAPNSFEIHMQAKATGDLFGQTPHVRALQKLDEIASVVNDTEAAIEVAKANRGHFVSAVTALMQFVSVTDTPVSYAWTEPQSSTVVHHTIRPKPAQALYEALVQKEELMKQEVSFVGTFNKLDKENGTWRLVTPEGDEYSGSISSESGVTLHGLTIGTKLYAVQCIERLLETTGSGRSTSKHEIVVPPIEIEPQV